MSIISKYIRKPPASCSRTLALAGQPTPSEDYTTSANAGQEDPEKEKFNAREQSLIALFKQCCSNTRDVSRIHAQIVKTGFDQHVFVAGRVVSFCCASEQGSVDYAASVFEELQYPDGFLFNTMIRGFGRTNRTEEAFSMYKRMRNRGKPADNFTFCFLLKICGQSTAVELGKQVHCCILKQGLHSHVYVSNTLIHMYGLFRGMDDALKVFEEMSHVDLVSWNTLLDGYVQCSGYEEACSVFLRMQRSGFRPDEATLVVALSACSELGNLDFGGRVHSSITASVLDQSISVSNSLIDMYAKCGAVDRAAQVFEVMKERNTVSWNSMILGLAVHGNSDDALRLFDRMLECNKPYNEPSDITFLGVLCACSHGGLVEQGRRYFDRMQREYGISPSIRHFGCMVDLLGRAGLVREAYELIKEMPMESNAVVWRTLLGACRVHGDLALAEVAKKHLARLDPDHSSDYVLLSHMYATKHQWKDVFDVREAMKGKGVQKPQPGNCLI
ncbi:uncharacterized protein A4U43_C08F22510 [Asparagus officinalis]|uniref:pentatricopeptide repeat-containing protein At4g21065-like n=1 Tax=Asparagus officinalis TaxID=4686 RepID=UPI00098DF2D7|nr:pentatricopeptide repeat-containing protein At4g21065-like [Asparagus officinalis]ONK60778.1 uncharacterized protein A4U43_C08F22510 [Asparagus officinalis]